MSKEQLTLLIQSFNAYRALALSLKVDLPRQANQYAKQALEIWQRLESENDKKQAITLKLVA